jgi:colanic acid/amylovoran biosynthesis glycosyltransferase
MSAEERFGALKVAYVTMSFPVPSETFATNDVRTLAARGVDMTVHSLRPRNEAATALVEERQLSGVGLSHNDGLGSVLRGLAVAASRPAAALDLLVRVIGRCATRPEQLFKSLALYPRALEVFGEILRQRPDVVHAYWSHYPSMVLYLVQRAMPAVVTSISFVAYDIVLGYRLSATVARRADLVRTLANVTVAQVEDRFGIQASRIEVIPDGVDLDLLPPPDERRPHHIVTAGRLIEKKGMQHVLRAFAAVRARWADATLSVLGAGPWLARLEALARELDVASAVDFPGHVGQRDALAAMGQATVFALLSETASERLPNVVKEAMVSGCVCIASRTDGIEELITDGVTGFVVDARDIDAVAGRIDRVFAGEVDVPAMRAAAAEHIRGGFSLDGSARKYLARWSELRRARARGSVGSMADRSGDQRR